MRRTSCLGLLSVVRPRGPTHTLAVEAAPPARYRDLADVRADLQQKSARPPAIETKQPPAREYLSLKSYLTRKQVITSAQVVLPPEGQSMLATSVATAVASQDDHSARSQPRRRPLFGRLFESEERRALSSCSDANEDCPGWADLGECKKNPDFMRAQCRLSCKVCELPANATLPKRTGCQDDEDFGCAEKAAAGGCDDDKAQMLINCPKSCKVCSFLKIIDEAFGCGDKHDNCQMWAKSGECKANPGFMSEQCTVSCDTCDKKRRACNRPPNTPPVVQPGDISKVYKRILSDFPQYNPKLISDPSTPVAKGRGGSAHVPPWVVTLENFLSDEEGEAFVSGCSSHFDRSLAGDQLSPVRTSQQCWCSDNACERNPLTQIVAERIANVTSVPTRYMEPFQVLKYETGQFYKQHHDQNSGLFTPQGVRVFTFFMYLSTPCAAARLENFSTRGFACSALHPPSLCCSHLHAPTLAQGGGRRH